MPGKHRNRNRNKNIKNSANAENININSSIEFPVLNETVIKESINDNKNSVLLKINNTVSNTSFNELMIVYKNTQYHTSNKRDMEYLTNIRKLINFYVSNFQYGIPCFRCAKNNTEDDEIKNTLTKLMNHLPISERKALIDNNVNMMIQNCIDSSSHNLEIHNVPLFMLDVNPIPGIGITENKLSFTPINSYILHEFFKSAGPINMMMQASDNTYFIWYESDETAIAVYNYLNEKGCKIDNNELKFKLRVRESSKIAWSKPIKNLIN